MCICGGQRTTSAVGVASLLPPRRCHRCSGLAATSVAVPSHCLPPNLFPFFLVTGFQGAPGGACYITEGALELCPPASLSLPTAHPLCPQSFQSTCCNPGNLTLVPLSQEVSGNSLLCSGDTDLHTWARLSSPAGTRNREDGLTPCPLSSLGSRPHAPSPLPTQGCPLTICTSTRGLGSGYKHCSRTPFPLTKPQPSWPAPSGQARPPLGSCRWL